MQRIVLFSISSLFLFTLAYGASVHLKGGAKAEPVFSDGGLTLSASGALSGLGNGDVLITLDATGDVISTCTNQGGNAAPGQNPAEIDVTGAVSIPESEIKNGNVNFSVVTVAPESPIPSAPGCPNPNWVQTIDDMAFTFASLSVEQGGDIVLMVDCVIDPASDDGVVPVGDVVCK